MLGIELFYEDSKLEVIHWGSVREDCGLYDTILFSANTLITLFKEHLSEYLYTGVWVVNPTEKGNIRVSVGYGDKTVFEGIYSEVDNSDEWKALQQFEENLGKLGEGIVSAQISVLKGECYVINVLTEKPTGTSPFVSKNSVW